MPRWGSLQGSNRSASISLAFRGVLELNSHNCKVFCDAVELTSHVCTFLCPVWAMLFNQDAVFCAACWSRSFSWLAFVLLLHFLVFFAIFLSLALLCERWCDGNEDRLVLQTKRPQSFTNVFCSLAIFSSFTHSHCIPVLQLGRVWKLCALTLSCPICALLKLDGFTTSIVVARLLSQIVSLLQYCCRRFMLLLIMTIMMMWIMVRRWWWPWTWLCKVVWGGIVESDLSLQKCGVVDEVCGKGPASCYHCHCQWVIIVSKGNGSENLLIMMVYNDKGKKLEKLRTRESQETTKRYKEHRDHRKHRKRGESRKDEEGTSQEKTNKSQEPRKNNKHVEKTHKPNQQSQRNPRQPDQDWKLFDQISW